MRNPAMFPNWPIEVDNPNAAPAFSFFARSMEIVDRTGMMVCSPVLKRTIKITTKTFDIKKGVVLLKRSPTLPPAIMATPILKTLLSANLYISARINISNRPGISLKNSTIPLSNGVT